MRLTFPNPVRLRQALVLVFLLVATLRLVAPPLTTALVGWAWELKVLITIDATWHNLLPILRLRSKCS